MEKMTFSKLGKTFKLCYMKSAKSNFNLNCTVCASIIKLHNNNKIIVFKQYRGSCKHGNALESMGNQFCGNTYGH